MNNFSLMARFNGWVNGRLHGSVARLPKEAYFAASGVFFGSVHKTLNHIMAVDRLWTRRIAGKDHGIESLDQELYPDFATLDDARRREDKYLVELVDGLTDSGLKRPVTFQRIIGTGEETMRCDHVLLTLFNHQTHHRGQVHALLTRRNIEIPPLDLGFFLDEIGKIRGHDPIVSP